MQAIEVAEPGGPEVLRPVQREQPVPGAGEILIKTTAIGVNRADLLQRQGHYPPPPGASPLLGLECSGTVAALGPDGSGWQAGDPCVALLAGGAYAEYVVAPAGQVVRPPEGVDLVTAGGLIEVAATVLANLDLVGLRAGERFLVHGGAGGIGSFAIQYAKAVGAEVIATAGSPEKLDYCRSVGADHALSYRDDWPAAVESITGGAGLDVILDNMGASYLEDHVRLLGTGGRLVVIGLQGGRKGTLDLGRLLAKRGQVHATSLRPRPVEEKAAICARVAERVWPTITDGRIRPAPQTTFPLAEAAAAHRLLESGDNLGKVLLLPQS
ncbi:NAD(P)H-quinone oxidoreductase [Microlunatus parietis]|uniref:Putative PIG3 family NAD(P)H quinone oxidoreductase n=1 Tax=Microlunatus parietis TaxID=682979 RepID=A0A7Y9LDH0_9ACTN|nr:NAD(P)H-quinone oxidoreductase [Microlunatus parietis]NYE71926.1 putative PIG3 family NAD(P)H quinone oxidoreductase [Microlunatus parietis]